jgi:hypothetical protein
MARGRSLRGGCPVSAAAQPGLQVVAIDIPAQGYGACRRGVTRAWVLRRTDLIVPPVAGFLR